VAGLAGIAITLVARRRAPNWDLPLTLVLTTTLVFMLISTNAQFVGWAPMLAIVSAVLVLTEWTGATGGIGRRGLLAGAAGLTGSVLLVCGLTLWHGTTLPGLLAGILILPAKQSTVFHVPWRSGWLAVCLGFSGLALACGYLLLRKRWGEQSQAFVIAALKILFGLATLGWFVQFAIQPSRALPHFWMFPFAWLVVIPPLDGAGRPGRCALLAVALLQPFIAFPVAGTQLSPATALILVIAAVALCDGSRFLMAHGVVPGTMLKFRAVAALASTVPVLLFLHGETKELSARYASLTPLELPGSSYIRVSAGEAAQYRALVATLARPEVGGFLTMPGMNSLYFWARKSPPTDLNVTAWMTLIDERGQAAIWEAARQCPGLLVVRNWQLTDMWMQGQPVNTIPLARHIEEDFVTLTNFGCYEIRSYRPSSQLGKL
jgi:hypothetical protein